MRIIKLFHGTTKTNLKYLDKIKSKKDNDFGSGLYFTSNLEQAKNWSIKKGKAKGAVYEIEIDLNKIPLKVIKYDKEKFNELCYHCRNKSEEQAKEFIEDFENADIIYGRMLGSIHLFKKYMNELHGNNFSILKNQDKIKSINYNVKCDIMTFEDLEKKIKLFGTEENDQYCFRSDKAIEFANKQIKKIHYTKIKIVSEKLVQFDNAERKIKYMNK